jgi:hypothetical protein
MNKKPTTKVIGDGVIVRADEDSLSGASDRMSSESMQAERDGTVNVRLADGSQVLVSKEAS